MQFLEEVFHIDLNQELYEKGLERTRVGGGGGRVEERDMTDVDEEDFEEKRDPCVRTTPFGKILKLLINRFY